jgi:hypothetical protein
MVDDRYTELILGPGDGQPIGALAGQEQGAKTAEIARADQPPKTTEWIAPRRAQASIANAACGTIGM